MSGTLNRKEAEKFYRRMLEGLKGKRSQKSDIKAYWDIYNAKITDKQRYAGVQPRENRVFVSVVRDAIEAKQLRLTNMLFPGNGNYSKVLAMDDRPTEQIASLLNHYVRKMGLRSTISSLLRAGEIEGQFSLFIEWEKKILKRLKKVKEDVEQDGLPTLEQETRIQETEYEDSCPSVWVIPTEQLVVLPPTVDRLEDADLVGILVWETESSIKAKAESGEYEYDVKKLLGALEQEGVAEEQEDAEKEHAEAAGIRAKEGTKRILVYQMWGKIKGEPYVVVMGGPNLILKCEPNPYYSQRIPILSVPYRKVPGSFFGQSAIKNVAPMQYALNDVANMGLDSAAFSLMPICITDPKENPVYESMMVSLAAIWLANPNTTRFVEMPALWQNSLQMMEAFKAQIMESLGLNPTMVPQGGYKKPTQAEIAAQQQLAVESIEEEISILEGEILTPLLQWMYEMDVQFREKPLSIPTWGEKGMKVAMEEIPVFEEMGDFQFLWMASEEEKNVQKVQQQVSAMNILSNLPPQALDGKKIDLGPIVQNLVESVFGPSMGSRVLKSMQDELSVPPQIENQMMMALHPAAVHPMDNDVLHIQVHMQGLQEAMPEGPEGNEEMGQLFQMHIQQHQAQLQAKQQPPPMAGPSGAPPRGMPRPGAQVTPLKGPQNPAGAIHQDRMKGPGVVPRPGRP